MRETSARAFLVSILCGSMLASAGLAQPGQAPDNSATNKRDKDKPSVTAGKQKHNKADLETTRNVRRAIMKDKTLSTYAHNVKVITLDGQVTLRGPVRSEDEKKAIGDKATEVAGAGKVDNQLKVAPGKSSKK